MNIIDFCERELSFDPTDAQRGTLDFFEENDESGIFSINQGPGGGSTTLSWILALYWIAALPERRVFIVSPTLDQGICNGHNTLNALLENAVPEISEYLVRTKTEVRLARYPDSKIRLMSPNMPIEKFRGIQGDGILIVVDGCDCLSGDLRDVLEEISERNTCASVFFH